MIRLLEEHLDAIRKHGASDFPNECCGVLLGDFENEMKRVREVRPLSNTFAPSAEFERSVSTVAEGSETVTLHGQERRYLVSPQEMFLLMREERRTGRKILGFYHSHPNHPAQPSEYDREWAAPWYSYLILSVREGVPAEWTVWQLDEEGQKFQAEMVETE